MYKSIFVFMLLLAWVAPAFAQAPPPAAVTGYELKIFQNGSLLSGMGEIALGPSAWTCGQQPAAGTAPAKLVNPTKVEIDDPTSTATPKLKCVTSQAAFFRNLPAGDNYRALLYAVSSLAQPPNDKSNPLVVLPDFQVTPVLGPPATPTGGRLLP